MMIDDANTEVQPASCEDTSLQTAPDPCDEPEPCDEPDPCDEPGARCTLDDLRFVGFTREIRGREKDRGGLAAAFYDELAADGSLAQLSELPRCELSGILRVSYEFSSQGFTSFIGVNTDAPLPDLAGICEYTLPAGEYARFACANDAAAINDMWNHVYFKWSSSGDYIHSGGDELEQLDGEHAVLFVPVIPRPERPPIQRRSFLGGLFPLLIGAAVGLLIGSQFGKAPLFMVLGLAGGMAFSLRKDKNKKD